MKNILLVLALGVAFSSMAQKLTLKKGVIVDSVQVNDSLVESFALYLPKRFDVTKSWPVVFVFDMQGRGKQSLGMFLEAAEKGGYILAASNNLQDSLSITKNVLITSRMFTTVATLFKIEKDRAYTAGFAAGGRLASVIPTFIKEIKGVISSGASITNLGVLDVKRPFHFIGIVGVEDFNYPEMIQVQKVLDKMRFPNQLLVFEGADEWPTPKYLSQAFDFFTLAAMAKNQIPKDTAYIAETYAENVNEFNLLLGGVKPLLANHLIEGMISVYQPLIDIDPLLEQEKALRKEKLYRAQNRSQNNVFFKETLIKEDYSYYLEEDILTYNYNNLGWWNYQMQELDKYEKSADQFERRMGKRLRSYLNALIADNLDLLGMDEPSDLEAINLLLMLKTIIAPKEFDNYLKIISNSAEMNDYGTALFYLEELLRQGFTDKTKLYALENTALLRITPEFNAIVEQYLKKARYEIIEE
tara:strand:+ start:2482 stop:3894 length:1413 start_codon:yes stop_codon:yes gene_type:complete